MEVALFTSTSLAMRALLLPLLIVLGPLGGRALADPQPVSDGPNVNTRLEALEAEVKHLREALQAATREEADPEHEPEHRHSSHDEDADEHLDERPTFAVDLELTFTLSTALAWFSVDEPLQTGEHDPHQTGFNFQQLEMRVAGSMDGVMRLDAAVVFGDHGVEIEEAYATTLGIPFGLQLRAGKMLHRFGRINRRHPHAWDFVDQTLMVGKFMGPESGRGLALELSWTAPTPWHLVLVVSGAEATDECCARSFYGDDGSPFQDPRDALITAAIEQAAELGPDWRFEWGLSVQSGPNASGPDRRTEIYGTDVMLRWRPRAGDGAQALTLQAEYAHRRRNTPTRPLADHALYAQLVYQHDAHWQFGGRYEWVSGLADDPLDPEWVTGRHRASLQASYRPSHFAQLRLQGNADVPRWLDEPVFGVMLALEVQVGTHGEHGH